MRFSVKHSSDVGELPNGTREVLLVRPISLQALKKLVPKTEKILMSPSTLDRLSKKAVHELRGKVAFQVSQSSPGRPLSVPPEMIKEVNDLKKEGLSIRQIAKETELSKSTVHYLLKYANANKIRIGDSVMHVSK